MKLEKLAEVAAPRRIFRTAKGNYPTVKRSPAKPNFSEESRVRSMLGKLRGCETRARISRGENIVTIKKINEKHKRQRVKLRESVIREAREIQEMARMTAESAMICLQQLIESPETRPSDKISAISLLLDRAYGKATQTNVNTNIDANGKEADVSATELDRRIKTALDRVEAITGGAGETPASTERPADVRELDRDPNSTTKH
jgi:hypothetical protein